MKNRLYLFIIMFFLAGCSSIENSGDNRVVAVINKYKMTVVDLRNELKNIPYDEKDLLNTEQGKDIYLKRLIEKQVLIQEAQRHGMDRDRDFMKAIEHYWEQELLKRLLQKKSEEIAASLSSSSDKMKRSDIEERETEEMNKWIDGLIEHSDIEVDKKAVEDVLSEREDFYE